jgi:hypothetical protein
MYPFVEGSSKHQSGPNGPITRIVIHGTCSGTHQGGAMENAHYFQQDTAGGLAHYVVDPGEIVQCCAEDTACWHAPPNHGSIGIELCDPQTGPAARWQSPQDEAMLHLAAQLVVEIAARTGVPLVRIGPADLRAGKHGICGHVDVTDAFHQSSHTDPGPDFPWSHFMDLVHAAAVPVVVKPHTHVPPTPIKPPPTPEPLKPKDIVMHVTATGHSKTLVTVEPDGDHLHLKALTDGQSSALAEAGLPLTRITTTAYNELIGMKKPVTA